MPQCAKKLRYIHRQKSLNDFILKIKEINPEVLDKIEIISFSNVKSICRIKFKESNLEKDIIAKDLYYRKFSKVYSHNRITFNRKLGGLQNNILLVGDYLGDKIGTTFKCSKCGSLFQFQIM